MTGMASANQGWKLLLFLSGLFFVYDSIFNILLQTNAVYNGNSQQNTKDDSNTNRRYNIKNKTDKKGNAKENHEKDNGEVCFGEGIFTIELNGSFIMMLANDIDIFAGCSG